MSGNIIHAVPTKEQSMMFPIDIFPQLKE